jgi:hypothetical protein
MERTKLSLMIFLGCAIGLAAAPSARALSISAPTIALAGANTADSIATSGANRSQTASSVSVLSGPSGGMLAGGTSDGFETRYAGLLAVDREAGGGSTALSATASYTISFTVDNPTGVPYLLAIESSRFGTVSLVDDSSGDATATLGGVTGLLNGIADPALGLVGIAPLTSAATASVGVAQTGSTLTLASSAMGSQLFTLAFSWNLSATSSQNEAAIRLGMPGGLASTTADDTSGALSGNGHFVDVTLTNAVPEPNTLVLIGSGMLALALTRSRRSR